MAYLEQDLYKQQLYNIMRKEYIKGLLAEDYLDQIK